ncbi:DUF4224 domain-containing protein [Paraburkholderia nemoris]|uniref:DUF4224 domain-containing protein n=1 Tax=Paraburkholderia nemoris TaxID=2793076 RepID=UPI0038B86101
MSDYLAAHELADLIGCKPNQRAVMIRWLKENQWRFVVDRNGVPKVARAFYEKQLGIVADTKVTKYDDGPNRDAFKKESR